MIINNNNIRVRVDILDIVQVKVDPNTFSYVQENIYIINREMLMKDL